MQPLREEGSFHSVYKGDFLVNDEISVVGSAATGGIPVEVPDVLINGSYPVNSVCQLSYHFTPPVLLLSRCQSPHAWSDYFSEHLLRGTAYRALIRRFAVGDVTAHATYVVFCIYVT